MIVVYDTLCRVWKMGKRSREKFGQKISVCTIVLLLVATATVLPQNGALAVKPKMDSIGKKNYFLPLLEGTVANGLVWAFDRWVLNADYANISVHTMKQNLQTGFVWDNDNISTNMFFHPYNGSLYYTLARANNLNYFASLGYAAIGSLTWELLLEREPPSLNDFLATSVGGSALGEVLFRLSGVIRSSTLECKNVLAFLVAPASGVHSWLSPSRGRESWLGTMPCSFTASLANRLIFADGKMQYSFGLGLEADYGSFFSSSNTKPFDAFECKTLLSVYNQPIISQFSIVASLYSELLDVDADNRSVVWGLYQHFHFMDSNPIAEGTVPYEFAIPVAWSVGYGVEWVSEVSTSSVMLFMEAVALGAVHSDYFVNVDRDYNMGPGVGVLLKWNYVRSRQLELNADLYYYIIYTLKGYPNESYAYRGNDLYLNSQGNTSMARIAMLDVNAKYYVSNYLYVWAQMGLYFRNTHYKYFASGATTAMDLQLGVGLRL